MNKSLVLMMRALMKVGIQMDTTASGDLPSLQNRKYVPDHG